MFIFQVEPNFSEPLPLEDVIAVTSSLPQNGVAVQMVHERCVTLAVCVYVSRDLTNFRLCKGFETESARTAVITS